MNRPFATIILAGGRGTRMGSSERHKVCFEVGGVPVILRALETYHLCGSQLNLVVVGMRAENVMATVSARFPETIFAYQTQPLGTGDATRRGAEILERMRFDGDVLVVAGDKLIEPAVIRQLLSRHRRSEADVTLVTGKRPERSNHGLILATVTGRITGILEESERRRLVALETLHAALQSQGALSYSTARDLLATTLSEAACAGLLRELWEGRALDQPLTRAEYSQRVPEPDGRGLVRLGGQLMPASRLLERCDQINLSTYLFRAPVLYSALQRLRPGRAHQEEYLTDVFALLAAPPRPARIVGCPVAPGQEVLDYNSPEELLAIEEYYRRKEGVDERVTVQQPSAQLASCAQWERLLAQPSAEARRRCRQWYGPDIPWDAFRRAVAAFGEHYGADRPALLIRSPGRINLLGRHVDHQGGSVNVMAINREIVLVASPRADDQVRLANLDGAVFAPQTFRISELVARLDWDDWQRVIDGPRLRRLLEEARGDWVNYVQAAMLRLQEQFRERRLRGMDMLVGGAIPMGAGLSSSSALVVAAAEATIRFNHLPVSAQRLVSLCGEGEWFVGTRGGAADHAAIKLSRRGYVTRVGFFPFQVEDSAPFFADHALVVCNSGIHAHKSSQARHRFNAQVTAYHLGRLYLKNLRPDLAPRIQHLRDIDAGALGLRRPEFYRWLAQLPARLTRREAQAFLSRVAADDAAKVQRLFESHDPPPHGYAVRDVVLFGLSEIARARCCLDLLRRGDAAGLGALMRLSHDGDRVSGFGKSRRGEVEVRSPSAVELQARGRKRGAGGEVLTLSGAYGCSLPALDRMVDLAEPLPGVRGAQMAGAGLGGCVMVLVTQSRAAAVVETLQEQGIAAEIFRPIAGAGCLEFC